MTNRLFKSWMSSVMAIIVFGFSLYAFMEDKVKLTGLVLLIVLSFFLLIAKDSEIKSVFRILSNTKK